MEQQMLRNKVAVITGASYGMGRTMAELFAEEGAAVVITARHAQQLNELVNGTRPFCGAVYTATKGALNTLTKNVAMRLIDTNIRCDAVAPGATVTPAHLASKAGEQPGGAEMLKYSGHYVYLPGPECDPMDQAYACLYLASKMGRAVRGQVIQVCNGAFL